jgi:putative transposase
MVYRGVTRHMTRAKNETIKASLKATKTRRTHQTCRVFTVKLDSSKLNKETQHHLKLLFLEAKWWYNHILAQPNIFEVDDKLSAVPVKVKDRFETRPLAHLSSQMKQSLLERAIANIRGLSGLKDNGHTVGWLKFKSRVSSIPLKQYGNTYEIVNDTYLRIQCLKQRVKVNGLDQLPEGVELANGILLERHGDYYVAITTYQEKEHTTPPPTKTVGIDFGLKNQLTLSDGIAIRYSIPLSLKKRLKKLHQQLSRQQKHSNNWYKTIPQLRKAYDKLNHIKQDISNKLVHYLHTRYGVVCFQDENLTGWQRLWGRKMLSTALGGLIGKLKDKVHTPIEVEKFFPSTKRCSRCGNIRDIGLDERIYVCPVCGLVMDRDHNSSVNLEREGLQQLPTGRRDVKPVETESSTVASLEYLKGISYVTACSVGEAGSPLL